MLRDARGRNTRMTRQQFLDSLPEFHKAKFDYSSTLYEGGSELITFTCPIHGTQEMKASKHKQSVYGCKECGRVAVNLAKFSKGYHAFWEKVKEIHQKRYNYTYTIYKGMNSKVRVFCYEHGYFEQTAANHVNETSHGCPSCAKLAGKDKLKLSKEEIFTRCRNKFGDRFEYDLSDYKNFNSPVKIKCRIHGKFTYKLSLHLDSETGCPSCNRDKEVPASNRISKKENVGRLEELYGNKYNFFTEDIGKGTDKIRYYCKAHHRLCTTQLRHLWNGSACSKCGHDKGSVKLTGFYNKTVIERKKLFYKRDPNHLYFIRLEGDKYKLGIAKDIKQRLSSLKHEAGFEPEVLLILSGSTYDLFYKEQEYLTKYKDFRYKYVKPFKGYTEVLQLTINQRDIIINQLRREV